ncbi:MAG: hypothetical protein JSV51_05810 [Candidatus Bathyarchaeota archaeon]|nr:MAG: hypothetical protein JSV51_05810 [Candidatus Bathyarchaeota archaeon]
MKYRVIIQTQTKDEIVEELNKEEDTIDDCLDILNEWIPNVIQRKNIINIQVLKED